MASYGIMASVRGVEISAQVEQGQGTRSVQVNQGTANALGQAGASIGVERACPRFVRPAKARQGRLAPWNEDEERGKGGGRGVRAGLGGR